MTLNSAVERGIEALDKIYVRTGGNSQREITIAFMREILSAMLADEEPDINRMHIDDLHRKQIMAEDRLARLEEIEKHLEVKDEDSRRSEKEINILIQENIRMKSRIMVLEERMNAEHIITKHNPLEPTVTSDLLGDAERSTVTYEDVLMACPVDAPKPSVEKCETIKNRYEEAQSLIDGVYEIVELWKAESPSQIEWKKRWLENARKHGASGE